MKTKSFNLLKLIKTFCFAFIAVAMISSCKKEKNERFSEKISSIISDEQMKALRDKGMAIHGGQDPPKISGNYLASPYKLISRFGLNDPFPVGKIIGDYEYHFFDQDGDEIKLTFDHSTDEGAGQGCYLSGDGNNFSLFAEVESVSSGIQNRTLVVISGAISAAGIKDFQYAFLLVDKDGDESNLILMPENTSRIWEDGDKLATFIPKSNTFRTQKTPYELLSTEIE